MEVDDGYNVYTYVHNLPNSHVDDYGLLSKDAKRCVCDMMKFSNYDPDKAFDLVNDIRAHSVKWTDPVYKPCDNYLFAFKLV